MGKINSEKNYIKKSKIMLKIITSLFFLFFTCLSAEIVEKLEVRGNDRISKETIRVYGEISVGKNYSAIDVDKALKNLYETNFFEDIQITLTNGILAIVVKEYPIINSINLDGEKSKTITKKVLEKLNLKAKESFIENKLTQDINLIKKIYASKGFNFVNEDPKIERFNNNRINLVYF